VRDFDIQAVLERLGGVQTNSTGTADLPDLAFQSDSRLTEKAQKVYNEYLQGNL
jgi:hypothetical protein